MPVISAVGHETDTTLADYAADLRAPTPSAAAELVSAHYGELEQRLTLVRRNLGRAMRRHLETRRARLERCRRAWGLRARLQASGPENVLKRGFSIVTHGKRERPVTSPDQVKPGQSVQIRSAGGTWRAVAIQPSAELFDEL